MTVFKMIRMAGLSLLVTTLLLVQAQAVDYPETVSVDDPGNVPDQTGYGSVSYMYRIAKYEVTNEQYCEFLNAAAKNAGDNALYRWQMGKTSITRSGIRGSYVYTIKDGMEKHPAALMNWHEAIQFCNWLSNGKGEGSLTDGPYKFVDEWGERTVRVPDHAALAREAKTQWVLASEDEWYKAAYYDPEKDDDAGGYWRYPAPGAEPPKANYNTEHTMKVGSFPDAKSAYGTLDQGGNLWEFVELGKSDKCSARGGSFWYQEGPRQMASSTRGQERPNWYVYDHYGFRVVALGKEE